MSDWTNNINQKKVADSANFIVENIIEEIYKLNLINFSSKNFSKYEIEFLLRWPTYVGVNMFIDRMLRVIYEKERVVYSFDIEPQEKFNFSNTPELLGYYYWDAFKNYKVLNEISEILSKDGLPKKKVFIKLKKDCQKISRNKKFRKKITAFLRMIFYYVEEKFVLLTKPDMLGEYSGWIRNMFFFGKSLHFTLHNLKYFDQDIELDHLIRMKIREVACSVFKNHIQKISDELPTSKMNKCADLFSKWLDNFIPTSILEGLNERYLFYSEILKHWNVKELHSFTGYYYNDNFKIFAIIAKRKGSKLVGHCHGANNYSYQSHKRSNELKFVDYYTTYGKKVPDSISKNLGSEKVVFIPLGSVKFNKVLKWGKKQRQSKIYKLLYVSGPLMRFMSDLQEISIQKNYDHRLKLLKLINNILDKNPDVNVLYKPFPGTYDYDPIKSKCKIYFDANRIQLSDKSLIHLFAEVDIVLFDSISTAFAECITAGAPLIVFNSKFEYNQTSPDGRIVNDALNKAGIQCFDGNSAYRSFYKILHKYEDYVKETKNALDMFKEDMAFPVSAREWRRKYKKSMLSYRSY